MKRKPWLLAVLLLPLLSCRPGADFKVSVRVIDEATGQPIPDAWVLAAVAVKVEPEREPPYNRAVAGARAKTDRRGIATFKDIQGIYWGEEPQDKLWLMLESRKPKVKRRITLLKEGDLFVFAEDYGAMHHPLHFKGTPQEHAGMGPFGIKGEDKAILLDPTELKDGAIVTIKMAKPDNEYLYGSFHPDTFLPAIWAATSKKTGATKAEKRAIYDFFVRNLAPLDRDRPEGADRGRIKPEALLEPKVIDRFVNHAPARGQSTAVQEWMAQKALELLPAGYEEVKEYAQEILAGVREEEEGDRPLNHYYDPSDPDKAMPGGETALKWGAIGYPDNPRNDWDWEDAIRYYRAGQKARAYRALGHVLHLLADLSSPLHTRVAQKDTATRGEAEDYERRLTDLAKANDRALPPQYAAGARMPVKSLPPAEAFDTVARAALSMDMAAMDGAAGVGSSLPQGIGAGAGLIARFLSAGSPGLSAKAPSGDTSADANDAEPQKSSQSIDASKSAPGRGIDLREQTARRDLARYGKLWDECKAGRRSEEDAYVIIRQLQRAYWNLERQSDPEMVLMAKEMEAIQKRHPDWWKRRMELSEEKVEREKREARRRKLDEKRKTWRPEDSAPMRVLFFENHVAAIYQYRIEFYSGPSDMRFPLSRDGYAELLEWRMPETIKKAIREGTVKKHGSVTFSHPIDFSPLSPRPGNSHFAICSLPSPIYHAKTPEESELIYWRTEFIDPAAQIQGTMCALMSIDGKTRVSLDFRQRPPASIFKPAGSTLDGASAMFIEGEAEKNLDHNFWTLKRCRSYWRANRDGALLEIPAAGIGAGDEFDMLAPYQVAGACPIP